MTLTDLKNIFSNSKQQTSVILTTLTPREEMVTIKFLENITLNEHETVIITKVEKKINHPSRLKLFQKIK
jgi:hypothetical protein